MIRKCLILVAISLFLGSIAFAEPLRTFFVKENRMPGPFNVEAGAIGQYKKTPDDYVPTGNGYDVYSAAPYTFNDKARDGNDEDKNVATFAGAFIWDLNDQLSLIAEAKGSNNKNVDGDIPMVFQGGIGYQATENLYINILGGGGKNTDENVIVSGKIAYCF